MTIRTTPADHSRDTTGAATCTPAGLLAAVALTQPLADVLHSAWTRTDEGNAPLVPLARGTVSDEAIRTAAQIAAAGLIAEIATRLTYGLPLGADHAIRTAAEVIPTASDADALTEALDNLLAGIGGQTVGADLAPYARLVQPIDDAIAYELRGGIHRGAFPTSVADRVLVRDQPRIVTGSAREVAERLVAPETITSWTKRDLVLALGGAHPSDLDEPIAASVIAAIDETATIDETGVTTPVATWKDAIELARTLRTAARKTARKIARTAA